MRTIRPLVHSCLLKPIEQQPKVEAKVEAKVVIAKGKEDIARVQTGLEFTQASKAAEARAKACVIDGPAGSTADMELIAGICTNDTSSTMVQL